MLSFPKTALAFVVVALTVPLFAGVLRSTGTPARPVATLSRATPTTGSAGSPPRSRPHLAVLPPVTRVRPKPRPRPAPVVFAARPVTPAPVPAPRPVATPAPAPRPVAVPVPAIVVGSTQQALINSDRAGAGLRGLTWSSCLASIAYQSAARMAAQGYISHAGAVYQAFGCGLGSSQTGENVGYWSAGINDYRLNSMFMASPEHRANVLGPYRYVGTAWVVARNGYAYISVVFG